MQQDGRLNFIRAVAVVMIVLCHFFQILHVYSVAFWLNTGVQIFFVLSAYLMSQKRFLSHGDVWQFYKKRLLRIMIPMWIYTACIILALVVLRNPVSPIAILLYALGLAGFAPSGILGLGHFWYITVILICYLLVPLMDYLTCRKGKWLCTTGISLLAIALMTLVGKSAYGVNMALFVLSYTYFRGENGKAQPKKHLLWIGAGAVIFNVLRIYLDTLQFTNPTLLQLYDGLFVTAGKCALAIFLFLLALALLKEKNYHPVVKYISDKSYEIYLTHQFILLAVNRYFPLPAQGYGIFFLALSVVLIILNTQALHWMHSLVYKMKVKS